MRARLTLALLVVCGWTAPLRADPGADIQVVIDCLAKLPPELPAGLKHISPLCPDLERSIDDSGLTPQLGDQWQTRLSASGLKDLLPLMQRYDAPPPAHAPGVDSIGAIARSLRSTPVTHSWWDRVKEWLRHLMQPRENSGPSLLWQLLSRILSVPKWAQRLLLFGPLTMILVLASLIVWREIKIARAGVRSTQRPERSGSGAVALDRSRQSGIEDLDAAQPWDKPALLLKLLVQKLISSGRLDAERSLTHSELTRRVTFDGVEQQQRFARIAALAEHRLYGPATGHEAADSPEFEQTLIAGRQLYEQLLP